MPQGGQDRRQSKEMSLRRGQPPTQVPGYDAERFLGMGAYGEVWVAVQRNTGRRVAIKFYAHRGGLDWSLLSREVEKLAFLFADRYVVQLIGVGWDATPPYYIMEYLDRGSLAERLETGPLPVDEATDLFHDVAMGLVHAHGKGVLHCDLKPANILLDQDARPRLADFGQSRLSHEQAPALGTLFYMAPEQADMDAVPDARWDVYALGALLYCMLTGSPPHRAPEAVRQLEQAADLPQRLAAYRRIIRRAARPQAHRQVPGVDRELVEILERCLAVDPQKRFPNVQAVLDALRARAARRARRPLVIFGALGPVLLLLVVGVFAWRGFASAVSQSEEALVARALESNKFAAQYVARATAGQVWRRYRSLNTLVESAELRKVFEETVHDPEIRPMLRRLADPDLAPEEAEPLIAEYLDHPQRHKLQAAFEAAIPADADADENGAAKGVNSWFLDDEWGTQIARVPEQTETVTIGRNYAWRSYFHGGRRDVTDKSWRPPPDQHVRATQTSAAYQSEATNLWNVAVSAPLRAGGDEFLGIAGLSVGIGDLVELQGKEHQFAVLVEAPTEDTPGHVLQHPLFDDVIQQAGRLPDELKELRVTTGSVPDTPRRKRHHEDPMGQYEGEGDDGAAGRYYRQRWLAESWPVEVGGRSTGWLVIVQESYDGAIGRTMAELRYDLYRWGIAAAASMVLVVVGLWAFAFRLSKDAGRRLLSLGGAGGTERPGASLTPGATPSSTTAGRRSTADEVTEALPYAESDNRRDRGNPNLETRNPEQTRTTNGG